MGTTSARLRFSEDELERFISDLWMTLERHQLPSPRLRLFASAAGATTVELCFDRGADMQRVVERWIGEPTVFATL